MFHSTWNLYINKITQKMNTVRSKSIFYDDNVFEYTFLIKRIIKAILGRIRENQW